MVVIVVGGGGSEGGSVEKGCPRTYGLLGPAIGLALAASCVCACVRAYVCVMSMRACVFVYVRMSEGVGERK